MCVYIHTYRMDYFGILRICTSPRLKLIYRSPLDDPEQVDRMISKNKKKKGPLTKYGNPSNEARLKC